MICGMAREERSSMAGDFRPGQRLVLRMPPFLREEELAEMLVRRSRSENPEGDVKHLRLAMNMMFDPNGSGCDASHHNYVTPMDALDDSMTNRRRMAPLTVLMDPSAMRHEPAGDEPSSEARLSVKDEPYRFRPWFVGEMAIEEEEDFY